MPLLNRSRSNSTLSDGSSSSGKHSKSINSIESTSFSLTHTHKQPPHNKMSSSSSTIRNFVNGQLHQVSIGFHSLSSSPPELWKAYTLKFLDSYAYFSFSLVCTLFLSQDFGMSDVEAGTIYGAWGALITVFGLFTGAIIDRLGVSKCLRIGFVLSFVSRAMLFSCTSKNVLLFCMMVALPLANCLGIPVLSIGLRRYTNDHNRGFAFGLFYVVMNVGALIAGPLVDVLTRYYNNIYKDTEGQSGYDAYNDDATIDAAWAMTSNRAIILSGVFANFIALFVAFSVREIKVDSNSHHISTAVESGDDLDDGIRIRESSAPNNKPSKNLSTFQPIQGDTLQILRETINTPNFRRFLLVVLLAVNVKMIFRHLDGTLPKYMIREFGENTPKGAVYSINPALIIILVPIVTAATSSVNPLVMIHYGTYVSAFSVFFLVFSTSLSACILFVITLSIGEAIWSPRLYDYTTTVAPEGREGTYVALSSAPLFLAKLPVGFISGVLLQKYCPEHLEEGEERHSKTMWLIIGLMSISSPLLITFFWSYISGGERSTGNDSQAASNREGDDEMYFQKDDDDDSYQHRPLTTKVSLPRVRGERSPPVGTLT